MLESQLSRQKIEDYLNTMTTVDTTDPALSLLNRFIKDLKIKIEFGHFEPEEEDTSNTVWEEMI
ncbi:hypothetical protein [Paenibacillus alba]|uniref:Uncharacterized protein n=1 Tax=Paenibacillus alba TaxID=1197127 RepID=A0ABU6GAC6_9BACL|nr:hypothetical protein [Paenibacillus alba]MEC0231153.1 hypothetical protein [Paenibacillus alba]